MRCQIPDREQKTKVFGPGSSATVSPYPRQLPTVPPAWRRRCPGRRSRPGGPRPPRATPRPAAITLRISEGTLPPQSLAQPWPGPAGRGGSRTGAAVTVPGRAPGKLRKLQRDRRGGRDQGDLGDHARGCGSTDSPNTPQSRAPATSGGGARQPLAPARVPGAKPRVPGYRAPGPPDRPGRSRRRAPVRPVPPSPPASLSPAAAADNKAAHEDVPRLRLGPSGPPGPALTCAAAGRAVQRGRAAARCCPRPDRPPTAPRSGYMAL
ncbi:translation initiation factor IF-2-like [Corvus kubaryi]|uniref:translation initiation factor IF-2-like n=1 Tax=Corvus kubaryi TaxID=68294 RepID=UPI001C044B50|nr:translation initiation factor IF-2-like [Corvus kubaryi]